MSNIFDIDLNRLDVGWCEQPGLYHKYAVQLADDRAEYERAKAEREVAQAEVERDVRSDPTKYGIEKVTEGSVASACVLQPKVRAAVERVIDAQHEMNVTQAMVDTLEHRKKALENSVQLQGRDYFSAPKAPVGSDARERLEERSKKEVRKKGIAR